MERERGPTDGNVAAPSPSGTPKARHADTAARPGPRPLALLPGVFMIAFLAGGLLLSLLAPSTLRPAEGDLLTGAWTKAYAARFDEELAIRPFAIGSWATLQWTLFSEGNRGVLVGDDEWLFTTEEFTLYPDERREIERKLRFVRTVRDTVWAHGGELVIVLVPSKARVYEDRLGRFPLPEHTLERLELFRGALERMNVPAPDLHTALGEARADADTYLRTDTHWSPFGALVTAREVERVVTQYVLMPTGRDEYRIVERDPEPFRGDLTAFIPTPEGIGPSSEWLVPLEVQAVEAREVGLFDDISIPVTLVGTSYSANGIWNFDGALRYALGADVLNASQEGLGPFVPMLEYLGSDRFENDPPELLVWEIPERYLGVPYDLETGELRLGEDVYGQPANGMY